MSEGNIDIRISCEGNEPKDLYKGIYFFCQLHQEKLAKINHQLSTTLSKSVVPLIVIEYPQMNLESSPIFSFKSEEFDSGFAKSGNKLYQYASLKVKESSKFIKNIQKQFSKITALDTSLSLKLSFYNLLAHEKVQSPLLLLNGLKIKGSVQTDPALWNSLTEIIRRVSLEFLNSPLMAFFELFERLNLKLELQRIEQFPQETQKRILSALNFSEWINRQHIEEWSKVKGELAVHITLPKLISIKIKGEAAVLASIFNNF